MRPNSVGEDYKTEIVRELASVLTKECNEWLTVLESPNRDELTPFECFHLWYGLGQLEFNDWSTLPPPERDALQKT